MPEWADYGVWKAEYDHKTHRIIKAEVVPKAYYTARVQEAEIMTRDQMVAALKEGKTFVAVIRYGNLWRKGAEMFLMEVEGDEYIRMHHTEVTMDNCEGLEEFSAQSRRDRR